MGSVLAVLLPFCLVFEREWKKDMKNLELLLLCCFFHSYASFVLPFSLSGEFHYGVDMHLVQGILCFSYSLR